MHPPGAGLRVDTTIGGSAVAIWKGTKHMPIYESQISFPTINPSSQHVACVVLVDVSGSMSGAPMAEVNEGLRALKRDLMNDATASGCAEISVIAFSDDARIVQPFAPVPDFVPPELSAGGLTAMNQAIILALEELEKRKQIYRAERIPYYRPWIFLMTDGEPTDEEYEAEAKSRLAQLVENKKAIFFAVACSDANIENLKGYKCRNGNILKMRGISFGSLFEWLSSSLTSTSQSIPGEKLELPALPNTITIEP